MNWDQSFPHGEDTFVGSVAELLSLRGEAREVATSRSRISHTFEDYDNWNGGTYAWRLSARIPAALYTRFSTAEINAAGIKITTAANELLGGRHAWWRASSPRS